MRDSTLPPACLPGDPGERFARAVTAAMDAPPVSAPVAPERPPSSAADGLAVTRHRAWQASWDLVVAMLLSFRPALPRRWPRLENWAVAALFFVSGVVQFNAVLHHGAQGQNYPGFFKVSAVLAAPAGGWHALAGQGPPAAYLVNAFFVWLSGKLHAKEVCGIFNLLVNLGALWMFYRLARRFIAGEGWRLTLLTLAAFLPVRMIHAVVLSGDALTLWPFLALAGVAIALTDPKSAAGGRLRLAWIACGLLSLGVLTKHTFLSALVAMFLIVLQMARRRLVPWREAVRLWVVILVLPLGLVCAQQLLHPGFAHATARSRQPDGRTAWSDVLWFHARDNLVLDAPPYENLLSTSSGRPKNLLPNPPAAYSYFALTHLGIFTDPLNIFQYDPTDAYFGKRGRRNQALMARAVKTALPISLLCLGATVLISSLAIVTGLRRPALSRPDLEAVHLLALGWIGSLVVFLPFVTAPCEGGAMLPRLAMPGLLLCLLLTVYVLERLLPGKMRRAASWAAFIYVFFQSVLQVSFLWPWGMM